MFLTEKEAKKKFCPFTFCAPADRSPTGEGITKGGPWHCIASECMAWRWMIHSERKGICGLTPLTSVPP